jgi:hypothetical protein
MGERKTVQDVHAYIERVAERFSWQVNNRGEMLDVLAAPAGTASRTRRSIVTSSVPASMPVRQTSRSMDTATVPSSSEKIST